MKIKPTKEDWENIKKTAELAIREHMINLKINRKILDYAIKELEKFPKEQKGD